MERAKVQVRFVRFFHSFFSCTMGVAAWPDHAHPGEQLGASGVPAGT